MERLDRARVIPPDRATQQRCGTCHRFARLLPGDTDCARCAGALALDFSTITMPSDTTVRGGW